MYQSDSELVVLHAVLEDPRCSFFKVLTKLLWPFWMTLTLTKERELNHLPNCWGWLEIPVEAFSVCTLSIVRKSGIILTLPRMRSAGKFEPILTTRGLTKCRHLGDVCKKHLLSHHCGICGYLRLADVYQSGKHLPNWENICLEAGKIIGIILFWLGLSFPVLMVQTFDCDKYFCNCREVAG